MSTDTGKSAAAAPSPELSPPVRVVLEEAAAVVASRPAATVDREHLVGTAKGLRQLLGLLKGAAGLRAATAAHPRVVRLNLPPPASGSTPEQIAANLIAVEPRYAAEGTSTMLGRIDSAEHSARRARRPPRPSAEQRGEHRARAKVEELRQARDRANTRAETYREEAARLRDRASALGEEIASLNVRLSAANARAAEARQAASDPLRLADALASFVSSAVPTNGQVGRAIQVGEPPRVDPGREKPESTPNLVERLRVAATQTPLPHEAQASVHEWLPELLSAIANPPRPSISVGDELALTVDVLGGGAQIGGSCVLISAGGTRLLIDAGTRPSGTDERSLAPRRVEEALSAPLDAIVVTHAHNDHGGWVPAILRQQTRVPVYVTEATLDLLSTMWLDAAKVLARRVRTSESWAGGPLPPYSRADVDRAVANLRVLPYGRCQRLGSVDIELFPAGHIVGAAGVVIRAGERRVVVSGDVSGPGQATVGGVEVPDSARRSDLLLLESTYAGHGRSPARRLVVEDFVRDVADTLDAGGRVLVPAFALGRAQEIALTLAQHLPDVEILVDGMARDIGEVYERHNGPDGKPLRVFSGNVRPAERGWNGADIARLRSGVVIATSGMLTSGPAVRWAEAILPDPRSALMIVGYQDEDSPGRRLMELAERGGREFALPQTSGGSTTVPVAARVKQYALGAHASADELVTIAAEVQAAEVMLVHGRREAQMAFARRLGLRGQLTTSADRQWTPRH